jgi:hypothetical protein
MSYSLSEARNLAEKIVENLPLSDSDSSTPSLKRSDSENSCTSRLTPEQKAALEPDDSDELEEGEIREDDEHEEEEEDEEKEEVIPQLKSSSSRSLSITNKDNNTLHLSVYDTDTGRRVYLNANTFDLPLDHFRNYVQELLEDDLEVLERNRHEQFEMIMEVSLILGGIFAVALIVWLTLFFQSLSRMH